MLVEERRKSFGPVPTLSVRVIWSSPSSYSSGWVSGSFMMRKEILTSRAETTIAWCCVNKRKSRQKSHSEKYHHSGARKMFSNIEWKKISCVLLLLSSSRTSFQRIIKSEANQIRKVLFTPMGLEDQNVPGVSQTFPFIPVSSILFLEFFSAHRLLFTFD